MVSFNLIPLRRVIMLTLALHAVISPSIIPVRPQTNLV